PLVRPMLLFVQVALSVQFHRFASCREIHAAVPCVAPNIRCQGCESSAVFALLLIFHGLKFPCLKLRNLPLLLRLLPSMPLAFLFFRFQDFVATLYPRMLPAAALRPF